ncbi:MAG TPA: hypothetical protein VN364_11550, partial [Bellilinea sp.]|nr:hypothetical protein [Bellilinea sp.]
NGIIKTLAYVVFIVLLVGCSKTPPVTSQPSPVESTLPAVPAATTPAPPINTPTPQITLVAEYTPTPRLITPAPSEGTFFDQSIVSPDKEWTALPAFETLATGYRVSLTVFNKDKSIIWTPVDYTGEGLGYTFPNPKGWSNDSKYFYYLESTVADGCGDFYPVDQTWQRLDVQTGQVDSIDLPSGRGHIFSPDESYVAYTTDSAEVELVILTTADQSEIKIPLPIIAADGQIPQAGGIRWSPDGKQLMLAAASGEFCGSSTIEFYLFAVQVSDLSVETLYQGKDFIRPLEWNSSGKVRVMDWNSKSWWIESETGKITTAP